MKRYNFSPSAIPGRIDTIDERLQSILGKGNVKELALYLAEEVTLSIDEIQNDLTLHESFELLKAFFTKYQPLSFNYIHKGRSSSGNGKYYIGKLTTSGGPFRTYIVTKNEKIIEIEFNIMK